MGHKVRNRILKRDEELFMAIQKSHAQKRELGYVHKDLHLTAPLHELSRELGDTQLLNLIKVHVCHSHIDMHVNAIKVFKQLSPEVFWSFKHCLNLFKPGQSGPLRVVNLTI
jgi:hypothetical protein